MRLGDSVETAESRAMREDRQANAETDWLNQKTSCTPEERARITEYIMHGHEVREALRWASDFETFLEVITNVENSITSHHQQHADRES